MEDDQNGWGWQERCGCLFLIVVVGLPTIGWKAVLFLAGIIIVFWILSGIWNKCPHCGKFGGLEDAGEEIISQSQPYNRVKDGELKVCVQAEWKQIKRCSACGHKIVEYWKGEREI